MSFLSHLLVICCAHYYAMQLSWPLAFFPFHCPITLVLNPNGSRNGCEPTNRYRLRFRFTTHVSKYVALRYIRFNFFNFTVPFSLLGGCLIINFVISAVERLCHCYDKVECGTTSSSYRRIGEFQCTPQSSYPSRTAPRTCPIVLPLRYHLHYCRRFPC